MWMLNLNNFINILHSSIKVQSMGTIDTGHWPLAPMDNIPWGEFPHAYTEAYNTAIWTQQNVPYGQKHILTHH